MAVSARAPALCRCRSVSQPASQPKEPRMSEAFAAAEPLLAEHAQIEAQLADPAVHADAANARRLGRRYAELGRVAQAYTAWKAASDDAEAAAELAEVDESFAAELPSLRQAADAAAARLREVLIPRDPDDSRDV